MVVLGGCFYFTGTGLGYFVGAGVMIHTGSFWTVNVAVGAYYRCLF